MSRSKKKVQTMRDVDFIKSHCLKFSPVLINFLGKVKEASQQKNSFDQCYTFSFLSEDLIKLEQFGVIKIMPNWGAVMGWVWGEVYKQFLVCFSNLEPQVTSSFFSKETEAWKDEMICLKSYSESGVRHLSQFNCLFLLYSTFTPLSLEGDSDPFSQFFSEIFSRILQQNSVLLVDRPGVWVGVVTYSWLFVYLLFILSMI